jgi:RNA polymerase sigma-70 factor (ECF subfamily)
MTKDELKLWTEIRLGDKKSLAQMYDLYVKVLYNYGCKVCPNPNLVEDAIQDVFIDIWRYREKLATPASVRFYLYASLRRRIIKENERNTNASLLKLDFYYDELHAIVNSEEMKVIQLEVINERTKRLKYNLNNLSPRQYEAVILYFYDELSYADIATIMEVNEQSVRNTIQRALEHLRQYTWFIMPLLLTSL